MASFNDQSAAAAAEKQERSSTLVEPVVAMEETDQSPVVGEGATSVKAMVVVGSPVEGVVEGNEGVAVEEVRVDQIVDEAVAAVGGGQETSGDTTEEVVRAPLGADDMPIMVQPLDKVPMEEGNGSGSPTVQVTHTVVLGDEDEADDAISPLVAAGDMRKDLREAIGRLTDLIEEEEEPAKAASPSPAQTPKARSKRPIELDSDDESEEETLGQKKRNIEKDLLSLKGGRTRSGHRVLR